MIQTKKQKQIHFANHNVAKPLLALVDYNLMPLQEGKVDTCELSMISTSLLTIAHYPHCTICNSKFFLKLVDAVLNNDWRMAHVQIFNLNRVYHLGTRKYVNQLLHFSRSRKMIESQATSLFFQGCSMYPDLKFSKLMNIRES